MIFVTVGTMAGFEDLVREVDRIAPELGEKTIIQIGKGRFKPKNCEFFEFRPDLTSYFKKARVIISHGGAGSCFEILALGKPLIGVENPEVNDKHQWDLLKKLEDEQYLVWCKDLSRLKKSIISCKTRKFKKYVPPACKIHEKIMAFMGT